MNKILSKIANDTKLAKAVIATGFSLGIISNVALYVGVYYFALHKGIQLMDEKEYKEAMNNESNNT